jgi:hypothetical protein
MQRLLRLIILCIFLPSLSHSSEILTWEGLLRAETCAPEDAQEAKITRSDFKWNLSLPEIKELAEQLYISGKRLSHRAHILDQDQVVIPRKNLQDELVPIVLTPLFIVSVRKHIEEALRLGYVNEIIFSDMGHSHFYVPQPFYDDVISKIPISDTFLRYEKMLSHPELKILYHTAEQLNMLTDGRPMEDRKVQWRFYTRNLLGDNKGEGRLELIHQESSSHNTARGIMEGYRYWGAGFYISASKNGCFPFKYKDKTYYFDINLHGIIL